MRPRFPRRDNGIRRITNRQIDFLGWVLFLISALFFIVASLGNLWAMVGSIFFFAACILFIIPFFRQDEDR